MTKKEQIKRVRALDVTWAKAYAMERNGKYPDTDTALTFLHMTRTKVGNEMEVAESRRWLAEHHGIAVEGSNLRRINHA